MKIKVFTAFSGYDSQCMALDMLRNNHTDFDYELVGWSEIDDNAIKMHSIFYPEYKKRNFGDISKINWDDVPDFDMFTYSFPCQDISAAGMQRGFTEDGGTRSSLLWECKKAIRNKKPRILVMENVKALVQKRFLPDFQKWLNFLEEEGYTNFYKVTNAKDFGIPQNRERVFCVSILDCQDEYVFPEPIPLELRLEDMLDDEDSVPLDYYIDTKKVEQFCDINKKKLCEEMGLDFLQQASIPFPNA